METVEDVAWFKKGEWVSNWNHSMRFRLEKWFLKGLWSVSSSDRDKQRARIRREQCWDWDRVVSPGLLFSVGAAQGLRNQMALFCFPDEPAQPLARSQTNTVGGGGDREVIRLWEKVMQCLIVKTLNFDVITYLTRTVNFEVDSTVPSCPESGSPVWQTYCSLRLKAGHLKHIVSNKQAHEHNTSLHHCFQVTLITLFIVTEPDLRWKSFWMMSAY